MEENQLRSQIHQTVIYFLGTLEMLVDFTLKAIGIYYIFYKLDPVNGAIILASSSLLTISVILANTLPKMTKEPRVYISLPDRIGPDKVGSTESRQTYDPRS